jgi:protein SCO1/2
LVKKTPTVIAPVYFTCPNVCNLLQSSLSNIVPEIKLAPGKDYQILSVSFDENDTPDIASRKKDNYMAALKNFPEDSWKFLTGDKDNIDKFMDSIGFKFRREGKDFIHSVALIILSPDGKIVRYVYGTRILPFDLTMAIVEAQKGEVGFSVKRVLSYCFSYDPNGKKYVFNVMKVSATIILAGVVTLFLVLTLTGKRKSTRGKDE